MGVINQLLVDTIHSDVDNTRKGRPANGMPGWQDAIFRDLGGDRGQGHRSIWCV